MGAFSVLNNVAANYALNGLNTTMSNLQRTLLRLATGSRINSAGDDPAGLILADGLKANITALQQSLRNANDAVGQLQVADGALAQVTNLLVRAVTIATEAANGTLNAQQRTALDSEFTQIRSEIDRIGSRTQYNGGALFNSAIGVFISDGTATGSSSISVTLAALSQASLSLDTVALSGSDGRNAQAALASITAAIGTVASNRGSLGAGLNRLQSAAAVVAAQAQNMQTAEDAIRAADMAEEIVNLTRLNVLAQTGTFALQQADTSMRAILALLR